jgi:hypothetical protein
MPIGKSRRIVIDVEDVALKRNLYAALAVEGRSLKDWFAWAAGEYLAIRSPRAPKQAMRVSERQTLGYRAPRKKAGS